MSPLLQLPSDEPLVVFSIKPKWAEAILEGVKPCEFRRTAPAIDTPYTGILNASQPVGGVVGAVRVHNDIRGSAAEIAARAPTHPHGDDEIREYLEGGRSPAALSLSDRREIEPRPLEDLFGVEPPQNFRYIREPVEQAKLGSYEVSP